MNKSFSEQTIRLFYRQNCEKAKKAMIYGRTMRRKLLEVDFGKPGMTSTVWKQIFASLGKSPKELLDKSLPEYQKRYRGTEMTDEDWINVIAHNPFLVRSPIAMRGNKALILDNPTDIYKL
jgi:arsenate reductase